MRALTKILIALGATFLVIQFIQPAHNNSGQVLATDLTRVMNVPLPVQNILQRSCSDCHSNNTHYPWYSRLQPIAWMMSNHIREGKNVLNLSDFGSYSLRRQISKLKSIASQVKDGDMPIASYKLMHAAAKLNADEKRILIDWATRSSDSLLAK